MVPQHACAVVGCALLEAAVRGPLRNAPGFVTLIAIGLLISLVWDLVHENQQVFSHSYRDLDLALGAHTNRLGRLGN